MIPIRFLRSGAFAVLVFGDAKDARRLGSHLLRMPDGKRHLTLGPASVGDKELRLVGRDILRRAGL